MEKQWQRGKVIDALACYCWEKVAMSIQGRMTIFNYYLCIIKLGTKNSERFNLVKRGLFTIGFFGH